MGSFADLFGPNESYEYFKLADQCPFDVRSTHFSLVNAGWLADCALLVYLQDEAQVALRHRHGIENPGRTASANRTRYAHRGGRR